jgi:Tol biopolymer transport system component
VRAPLLLAALLFVPLLPGSASGGSYAPPPGDSLPTWSPDGTRIAFLTGRDGTALAVVPVDSRRETRILDVLGVGWYPDPTAVAVSPDWQWVAVTRAASDGLRLGTVRMDGAAAHDLGQVQYGAAPEWSPDSRRVAFRMADGTLAAVGVEGGGLVRLAPGGASLAWSPDGARIAFAGGAPGDLDIHVVDADGRNDVVLAGGPGAQLEPRWSADGTRIAFLTQPAGGEPFALAVMRSDGADLRTYPGPGVSNTDSFAWTPDGEALVYARAATQGLVRLDLASGRQQRLTAMGANPAVSPDGKRLAFAAGGECRDRLGIYLARADGTQPRRLTNDCRIVGTAGADVVEGTPLADVLVGLAGDDRLRARDPGYVGDTLLGGDGSDVLLGGYRGDLLRGGRGDDRIRGGNSEDVLVGGPGRDRMDGQSGRDFVYARDGRRDTVVCGTNLRRRSRLERDEVWADRLDLVSADCEVVHRSR